VALLLGGPRELAMGDRLDPLFHTERLISQGDFAEALRLLDRVPEGGRGVLEKRRVHLQEAVCRKALGQLQVALEALRAEEARIPEIADYLAFWEAECLVGLGLPDSAAARFTHVLSESPSASLRDRAALRVGGHLTSRGEARQAVRILTPLVGRSGREGSVLTELAEALEASGDSAQARGVWLKLLKQYPESRRSLVALGRVDPLRGVAERFHAGKALAGNRRYSKAAAHFREIVKKSPERHWQGRAQYELGRVYYRREHYRTAERAYEKAYRMYGVPKALLEMGKCSVKLGRDLEAAERLQLFADLYPSVSGAAGALWDAAMAYERRRAFRDARSVFVRLASRYPKSSRADLSRWRAGYTLYRTGKYAQSAEAFLRLVGISSEPYLADQGAYWAAKCYQKLGRESDAAVWLTRAAEGFPSSYYSARARAVLGITSEHYPEAADADTAAALASYEPCAFLLRGDQLASLGHYRLAASEYRRAESVHGTNVYALGDLLERYERIRATHAALRTSGRIASLELQRGTPTTLASFRRLYPTYYWGEISAAAQEADVDPNLVLAIVRQESAFDEEALSPVGARGLMQVMPETGRNMARRARMGDFRVSDLWNPRVSIRLGTRHLSDHLRYFDRRDERRLGLALSAYNAGLNAARRWSRRLQDYDVDEFVESIPYRETRKYVKLVYRNYKVYSYLQEAEPGQDLRQVE